MKSKNNSKLQLLHRFGLIVFLSLLVACIAAQTPASNSNRTLNWQECIDGYKKLDMAHERAKLVEIGKTDIGKPLYCFVINPDTVFFPELFDRNKPILFVNNAIHPGEPDGVDASLKFCERYLSGEIDGLAEQSSNLIICVIPMYNVDGALNRGSFSRANQDGPEEYGFRGNARNLDLNRDFIKCDSENARSFARWFTRIKPHVLVDTHVSNGADYQHTMTLITTQPDKLGGKLGEYVRTTFTPALFNGMERAGHNMCPYVNTMGRLPESGLVDFLETPRFCTGYGALFNTIGYTTETHMLKPFAERTESTYQFLVVMAKQMAAKTDELVMMREMADRELQEQKYFAVSWDLDTNQRDSFRFKGFTAVEKQSAFGQSRLWYDHGAPWTRDIPYYNRYRTGIVVQAPDFYLVPQAWREVIERLKCNQVLMQQLTQDSLMEVEAYFIDHFESPSVPYEGHYNHHSIEVSTRKIRVQCYAGDWLIPADQQARRYLIEVLEPQGEDSFFAWNFFDSVLQQKEWFSDYVFEEKAVELLEKDQELAALFEAEKVKSQDMRESRWLQLYWIYKHSPWYEQTAFRYPVFRITDR